MIGPALYLWMVAQQPEPATSFSYASTMQMPVDHVVMVIPLSKDRHQLPAYFERRGDERCVLLYTFGEDEKNWERIEMCSTRVLTHREGKLVPVARTLNTSLNCAGKGCEP